ncbi:hypothetical protein VKT23_008244 [Stygiomarasmius scandens]|uniref:Uncharacterized protein n=1 Tax=Marasmiellus scandens TaxID=2682957 RepID=A0ABR1JLY1_9AGAR
MVPPPTKASRRTGNASRMDTPDETELVNKRLDSVPLSGSHHSVHATASASSTGNHRSAPPNGVSVGHEVERDPISESVPTGTSTARNRRTVSTTANSLNPNPTSIITQNNLDVETLQIFTEASHNKFNKPTFNTPAGDFVSINYTFHCQHCQSYHDSSRSGMIHTHSTGVQEFIVPDGQVPVGSRRPRMDADDLRSRRAPGAEVGNSGTRRGRTTRRRYTCRKCRNDPRQDPDNLVIKRVFRPNFLSQVIRAYQKR